MSSSAGFRLLAATVLLIAAPWVASQGGPAAEFKSLAERLYAERLRGIESEESLQEKALSILDALVLNGLEKSPPGALALEEINRRLAGMISQEAAAGENYQVQVPGAGGEPSVVALAANFGLSGPAAVRVYARANGRWRRTGRIDRFWKKGLFDESVALAWLEAPGSPALLSVTGRTDELRTGAFAAWRLVRGAPELLWETDLIQQSSFQVTAGNLRLTYCAEADEDCPRVCRRMARECYRWDGVSWTRAEHSVSPVTPP